MNLRIDINLSSSLEGMVNMVSGTNCTIIAELDNYSNVNLVKAILLANELNVDLRLSAINDKPCLTMLKISMENNIDFEEEEEEE